MSDDWPDPYHRDNCKRYRVTNAFGKQRELSTPHGPAAARRWARTVMWPSTEPFEIEEIEPEQESCKRPERSRD